MSYGGDCSSPIEALTPRGSTMTDKLEGEKERLEKRLTQVNRAIEILEKNPQMKELLNIVSRVV